MKPAESVCLSVCLSQAIVWIPFFYRGDWVFQKSQEGVGSEFCRLIPRGVSQGWRGWISIGGINCFLGYQVQITCHIISLSWILSYSIFSFHDWCLLSDRAKNPLLETIEQGLFDVRKRLYTAGGWKGWDPKIGGMNYWRGGSYPSAHCDQIFFPCI